MGGWIQPDANCSAGLLRRMSHPVPPRRNTYCADSPTLSGTPYTGEGRNALPAQTLSPNTLFPSLPNPSGPQSLTLYSLLQSTSHTRHLPPPCPVRPRPRPMPGTWLRRLCTRPARKDTRPLSDRPQPTNKRALGTGLSARCTSQPRATKLSSLRGAQTVKAALGVQP